MLQGEPSDGTEIQTTCAFMLISMLQLSY